MNNRTEEMNDFETLIDKSQIKYEDRWHPTTVDPFKSIVSQGVLKSIKINIKNNISYNMQYLEYLELQKKYLNLHNVVKGMLYKTYVVTTMSIIEAIFHQALLCSDKWPKTSGWEEENKVSTTEYQQNNEKHKMEVITYKKSESENKELDFCTIINKIKDKGILDLNSEYYPDISRLRKLRNRIHLQIGETEQDTDFYNFSLEDVKLAKRTLYAVLTDHKIMTDRTDINKLDFLISD